MTQQRVVIQPHLIQQAAGGRILSDDEARSLYGRGDAAHDFDHVRRVTDLALHIAQVEGADLTVVRLAALLHDVPVPATSEAARHADAHALRQRHHLSAAAYARDLLIARGLGTRQADQVVHCIEAHRFRDQSIQPQTLEAQCLYDADKLDSIGAIGIGRAFAYAGAHGSRLWTEPWRAVSPSDARPSGPNYTPVHEYVYKLQRIVDTLHTATARAIGQARHAYMVEFFEQLDAEMTGAR